MAEKTEKPGANNYLKLLDDLHRQEQEIANNLRAERQEHMDQIRHHVEQLDMIDDALSLGEWPLSSTAMREWIINQLKTAPATMVLLTKMFEHTFGHRFSDEDKSVAKNGEMPRWRKRFSHVREKLVKSGVVVMPKKGAPLRLAKQPA